MPPQIPDKVYFKIGEVADIVGVETHVLRFWETEFPQVRPDRAVSKQRLYRRKDVDVFLEIKRLLYDEEFTISGARKKMKQLPNNQPVEPVQNGNRVLIQVKEELAEIKKILESD